MFLTVDRKEVICWVAEGGVELEELQRVVLAACGEGVDLVAHMLLWGVLREVQKFIVLPVIGVICLRWRTSYACGCFPPEAIPYSVGRVVLPY